MLDVVNSIQGLHKHLTMDCDKCIYFGGGASVIACLYGLSYSIIDGKPFGNVKPCGEQRVKLASLIVNGCLLVIV